MNPTPKKLKVDPIVEALLEVRFTSAELPEFVIGKLVAESQWTKLAPERLPFADMPGPIRDSDPTLKFQPTIQLVSPTKAFAVKIGPHVLSMHTLKPYPGWAVFGDELHRGLAFLFSALAGFQAVRFGFRYVNMFTKEQHGVSGLNELNLHISLANDALNTDANLNYIRSSGSDFNSLVRLASAAFVAPRPGDMTVLADIDIFTPDAFSTADVDVAHAWLENAHNLLKDEFFKLFTDDLKKRLVEN